jgi:beta-lactamase superfamily II metal-dependent hydrolase
MKKDHLLTFVFFLLFPALLPAAKTLEIYVIDTEGGKALLIISPSGQSMLVDTGFPGNNDRDTNRIVEAVRVAGVKRLNFLLVTHYDLDHVNNVPATAAKIPVDTFIDHGPPIVADPNTTKAVAAYLDVAAKAKRVIVKPGDRIPFKGVDVLVVTSATQAIKTPVKGGGAANPVCQNSPAKPADDKVDKAENAASVGLLYTFGKFRMLDLADLVWNKEIELMCPINPIGTVDLLMVSHHGNDLSNSPALIHAVRPKVTIMNNGARKTGAPVVLKTVKSSPGLEAAYQLHWSENAPEDNSPDEWIANLRDSPDGKWIKVSAEKDGTFTVTNGRTGVSKVFKK